MTSLESFKIGFLARCAAEGLTPEQILKRAEAMEDRVTKLAGVLSTVAGKAMDAGQGIAGGAVGYGVPLALVAPWLVGGIAGFGASKATDIDDTDVDAIKDREVIDEYGRQTARLKRQLAVRGYQADRKRTGRMFV